MNQQIFSFISMNYVFELTILIISNYLIGGLKHVKKFNIWIFET